MSPDSQRPRDRPGRRVTIHDVAREAGVSTTTVSLAVNNKGTLASSTRERVTEVAQRMRYQAHPAAAGLRRGRTGVMGLDIRPLDSLGGYSPDGVDHFVRFAGAAAVTAVEHGMGLMLVPDLARGSIPGTRAAVDGYIICDPIESDPVLSTLIDQGHQVVTVGRDPARPDLAPWINTDDTGTARQVLDFLWDSGARHVSVVTGTDTNSWNADVGTAYEAWCAERGMVADIHRVPEAEGLDGGKNALRNLLVASPSFDAVFCQTGRHAAGLYAAATAMGRSVPGDLMIVAGSDSEHTRGNPVPITSVDLRPEKLGRMAVERLVSLLTGEPFPGPVIVKPLLVKRATTVGDLASEWTSPPSLE